MHSNVIYTIGFTKKKAREFFGLLKKYNISLLIDVRLNNVSQLAGFAKKEDLQFFLEEICGCEYEHKPEWAPTKDILYRYKKKQIDWMAYEKDFLRLLSDRKIEHGVDVKRLGSAVLLCSESRPDKCHRRLVAEYLKCMVGDIEIHHL